MSAESATYEALGLVKGVGQTFLSWDTPLAIKRRMDSGQTKDLQDVLSRWEPWIPPKQDQAFQQGGVLVFEGSRLLFSHYDKATADHADLKMVLGVSLAGLAAGDSCGTSECELPNAGAN